MRSLRMHELAICQELLDQLSEVVRANQAERVLSATLRIGPLAGIEPALLRDAFPLTAAGTVAEGAQLVIEHTEVQVKCRECGAQTQAPGANRLTCGACGSWRTDVLAGEELLLTRVDLVA